MERPNRQCRKTFFSLGTGLPLWEHVIFDLEFFTFFVSKSGWHRGENWKVNTLEVQMGQNEWKVMYLTDVGLILWWRLFLVWRILTLMFHRRMPNYTISLEAYSKLILHAHRYPTQQIHGVLLAKNVKDSSNVAITDSIPLFHSYILGPMLEVALLQARIQIHWLNECAFIFGSESRIS